jgi:hypothetical protein
VHHSLAPQFTFSSIKSSGDQARSAKWKRNNKLVKKDGIYYCLLNCKEKKTTKSEQVMEKDMSTTTSRMKRSKDWKKI